MMSLAASADLQIGEALALQLRDGGDAGGHELQERLGAGLARVDLEPLVGDLAEIGLETVLRQPDEALVDLRIDRLLLPGGAGKVLEEELDRGSVRNDDELQLQRIGLVDRIMIVDVVQE